jgi:hypothetical protein
MAEREQDANRIAQQIREAEARDVAVIVGITLRQL